MYLHIVQIMAQTVQIMAIIRMVCAIIRTVCAIIRTVCKMCPDIQKHSMKNARILFIVKSEFLGYNVKCVLRVPQAVGLQLPCYPSKQGELSENL